VSSPRVRILAAVVFVAVLGPSAAFLLLGQESSSSAAVKVIKPLHPIKKQAAAPTKQPAKKAATRLAAKITVKHAPKAKRARNLAAVIDGMPAALALGLRSHEVVVVSLYTPGASVDKLATEEARGGASLARAGFVAVNVANEKIVSPLAALLARAPTAADRVLDGPAVLVFRRPNELFVRLNGFADRDTVAQAAANAAAQ
jgi:hypothetical protein